MKSYLAIMLLFTVGCASQTYWYQEGKSLADCQQDMRECQYDVTKYGYVQMNNNSDNPRAALLGWLIESNSRRNEVMNGCMVAKGYRLLTKEQLEQISVRPTTSGSVSGPTSQSGLVNRLPETYALITDAEMAEDRKDWSTAASKFGAAIARLRQIKSEITSQEPAWLSAEVEERINYCQEQLDQISVKSVEQTTRSATTSPYVAPVNEPSTQGVYHRFFVLALCSDCNAKEVERQISDGLNSDHVPAVCPADISDHPDRGDLDTVCGWLHAKGFDALITIAQPEGDSWKGKIALTLMDTAKQSKVKVYPVDDALRNLGSVSHVGWLLGEQLRQDAYFVVPKQLIPMKYVVFVGCTNCDEKLTVDYSHALASSLQSNGISAVSWFETGLDLNSPNISDRTKTDWLMANGYHISMRILGEGEFTNMVARFILTDLARKQIILDSVFTNRFSQGTLDFGNWGAELTDSLRQLGLDRLGVPKQ